jgi:hypothetical protein
MQPVCQRGPVKTATLPELVQGRNLQAIARNSPHRGELFCVRAHLYCQAEITLPSLTVLYILPILYLYTATSEAMMEHVVRVYNEKDRRTLEWLRQKVGDAAITLAAEHCGRSEKPYLSALCRYLGVSAPTFLPLSRRTPSPAAEESLAAIRSILAAPTTSTAATLRDLH